MYINRKQIMSQLIVFLLVYILMAVLLYLSQEKLIFFPPAKNIPLYNAIKDHEIRIRGDYEIQAWHIKNKDINNGKVIIYFGGNAEDASSSLDIASKFLVSHVIYVNLSGYGESEGKPGESSFFSGGLAVFDYVHKKMQIDQSKIILMGRSIGSATAIYVAAERRPKSLIVITPLESIRAMMPLIFRFVLPFDFLLKSKFNNKENIKRVKSPVLILYAAEDEIIPFEQVKNIYSSVKNKAVLKKIKDVNHQTILLSEKVYSEVNIFISQY